MDVDLLKPGNLPISSKASLWLWFLIQPDKLKIQLKNPKAGYMVFAINFIFCKICFVWKTDMFFFLILYVIDPTPTELIIKFITLAQSEKSLSIDTAINNHTNPFSKRCLVLKILALKVASSLKWNLDVFEKS